VKRKVIKGVARLLIGAASTHRNLLGRGFFYVEQGCDISSHCGHLCQWVSGHE